MTSPGAKLLLASRNAGKIRELAHMLPAGITVVGLADFPDYRETAETGATFAENALAKAEHAAFATGLLTLADDSGLAVDALNGMPGVLSARWSGTHGDDSANNALLLAQLSDVPDDRRGAAFICAMALVDPAGAVQVCRGRWPGLIARQTSGNNGFGYDPLFIPEESVRDGSMATSAQLSAQRKDELSHRGRAMAQMVPLLVAHLARS